MDGADNDVNKLLIKHPSVSAATFMNLLKSQGIKVMKVSPPPLNDGTEVKPTKPMDKKNWKVWEMLPNIPKKKKKEADSVSNAPVGILAAKESSFKINPSYVRLSEKQGPDKDIVGPTKFTVKIIEEGMGNTNDAFYYSKEALQSAVPIFEGKKIYADHPSRIEEQDRPERSIRDVVGHFENVNYQEDENGRGFLEATAVILPDEPYRWARGLMRHAVEYSQKFPDKDFIGISINASGDASPQNIQEMIKSGDVPDSAKMKLEKAMNEGIESVKVVKEIKSAVSADLVTEAGAGGKVLKLLESEAKDPETIQKTWDSLTSGEEHKITACMKRVEGKVDDPGAYCNWLATQVGYKENNQEESMEKEGQVHEEKHKKEADDHADEEQDKKLILDMIKKHMDGEVAEPGKNEDEGEAQSKDGDEHKDADDAMYEAYQAYREMGYEKEAAVQATSHAMKLARHMHEKHGHQEAECMDKEAHKEGEAKEDKKMESEIIRLKGENTKLKESLAKHDLEKHIEKALGDTKLPRAVTKKIREAAAGAKTAADFDRIMKVFMEGYKAQTDAGEGTLSNIVIQPEKAPPATITKGLSFEDCIKR